MKKNPLKSKTLWANFLMAGLAFFPGVADKIDATQMALIMSAVNFLLRFATKEKIGLE